MNSYGYTGSVFLPTSFIDHAEGGLKGKKHLNWRQVKEIQNAGIEIGSHTVTHPRLYDLRPGLWEKEIEDSKRIIEEKAGIRVKCFSYPYRFPEQDSKFIAVLKDCLERSGYEYGVSTRIGCNHRNGEAFYLRRIPVNSGDDLALLKAKLEGNYDWLSGIQKLQKSLLK